MEPGWTSGWDNDGFLRMEVEKEKERLGFVIAINTPSVKYKRPSRN